MRTYELHYEETLSSGAVARYLVEISASSDEQARAGAKDFIHQRGNLKGIKDVRALILNRVKRTAIPMGRKT